MNRVFKNIFNKATGEYVVASEHARGHSKSQKAMTTCLAIIGLTCGTFSLAQAAALENSLVYIGVANNGTLGSGPQGSLGMQYDPTANGAFRPYDNDKDYLRDRPWQMFSVSSKETGEGRDYAQRNQNDDSLGLYSRNDITTISPTTTTTQDSSQGQQSASWTGQYTHSDGLTYYTIKNEYSVDNSLHGVAVETTITALQDLTDVKFATAVDPDLPNSSTNRTYNFRGDTDRNLSENDWIYAVETSDPKNTNSMLGIYSNSSYQHNTSVSTDWSTDPADYLKGNSYTEHGQYAIGMGFDIGNLMAGDYAVIDYAYLFGFPSLLPPVNPPATEEWTNIDLAQSAYQSTKLNGSTTYDPTLGVNVRPIFEGGTLQIDHGSESRFYANDFTMNELGGKIDANATESRFKGVFSNTTGVAQAGDFYILDHSNQQGKVIFEGQNTYNGKTIIENATLALALGGDLKYSSGVHLAHSDAVFDVSQVTAKATQIQDLSSTAGTVYTGNTVLSAGTERDTTFAGQFTGQGGYNKIGTGTQHITGQSADFAGVSNVAQGTLRVDGLLNNHALNVLEDATLSGQGFVGGLVTAYNGSFIDPNGDDFGRLTLMDNYIGEANSNILIQTVLGNDNSQTDVLAIQGNTTGSALVKVENMNGQGAYTDQGIKIIDVDGQSDAQFVLANGPIRVNAFEYNLLQNSPADANDGDWYLRSTYRAGIGNYISTLSSNIETGLTTIASLYQRIGSPYEPDANYKTTWGRLIGNSIQKNGETQFDYNQYSMGYQLGGEYLAIDKANSKHRFGVMNHLIHANAKTYDNQRLALGLGHQNSSIDTDSFGFGAYYTATFNNNMYLDAVTQLNYIENSIEVQAEPDFTWEAWQTATSLELGRAFDLGAQTKIEPQAQLSYIYTTYRDAQDAYSTVIADSTSSILARIGAQVNHGFNYKERPVSAYGLLNYKHEFAPDHKLRLVSVTDNSEIRLTESYEQSWIEAGLGIQAQLANLYYVYSDLRYSSDINGDSKATQFNIGMKGRF